MSNAYYRNTELGARHLRQSGFSDAEDGSWGGGFVGITTKLDSGHELHIAAPNPGEWPGWHLAVHRPAETSEGSEAIHDNDGTLNSKVTDLHTHVRAFLRHPDTVAALRADMPAHQEAMRQHIERGNISGRQFGG